MLLVNNLTKRIGTKIILDDINLSVKKGSLSVLLGQNGVGKTTLIKCITGLLSYKKGNVTYSNAKLGISLNDKDILISKLTIFEYLKLVGELNSIDNNLLNSSIEELLVYFSLMEDRNKLIYKLSKGGISKVSLIGALLINPKIIILDEPFSGMDMLSVEKTRMILKQKKEEGCAILVSTHNLELLQDISNQILILKNKSLIAVEGAKTSIEILEILKK